ncbi:MAG TPA: formate--tetrahydrofolate ligase [Burkholderiales bacterium]|nr:formate--tetrahydrofolate ligase [Burkholderiales bacterium]
MPSDSEIARAVRPVPVAELARDRLGAPAGAVIPQGVDKAKLALPWLELLPENPGARLVLVTAMTPTSRGEGKTGTAIGLADALSRRGRRAMVCLREPSMGPVFGMKGGASGSGRAQLLPREDINLHFTGDFHAVATAHNLLAAMLDNHLYRGNALGLESVSWRRVLDLNDRALRSVLTGAEAGPGQPQRLSGFDIAAASEVMAILALAQSWEDLTRRVGAIVVGRTRSGKPVRATDLKAAGAMAALLRDALQPNLVQTLEHTPALVHAGPFANIAHGCSSVVATRAALRLAEYVVTEAGFGADLGAEKFVDIKCRQSGLRPDAAVVVATLSALKHHGGAENLGAADCAALERGMGNLLRHVGIVRDLLGLPCVVCLNRFAEDADRELDLARRLLAGSGVEGLVSEHWARGGAGAEDLARWVEAVPRGAAARGVYPADAALAHQLETISRRVYGAAGITLEARAREEIARLEAEGCGALPVCVAKTQYSFTTDPSVRGAPEGHMIRIRDVRLSAGAGFVVALAGDIPTMPGLPARPRAEAIALAPDGRITGLD